MRPCVEEHNNCTFHYPTPREVDDPPLLSQNSPRGGSLNCSLYSVVRSTSRWISDGSTAQPVLENAQGSLNEKECSLLRGKRPWSIRRLLKLQGAGQKGIQQNVVLRNVNVRLSLQDYARAPTRRTRARHQGQASRSINIESVNWRTATPSCSKSLSSVPLKFKLPLTADVNTISIYMVDLLSKASASYVHIALSPSPSVER